MRLLAPWLLLAGCWVTPDEVDEVLDPGAETEELGDIDITAVEPDWGPSSGGTAVSVLASPLVADARVWFGEVQAEVTSVQDDRLLVIAPEAPAGPAVVRVEASTGEGQLEGGFTYWQDAEGDLALLGAHSWYEPVGVLEEAPWGDTWLLFHEPAQVDIREWFGPPLDTCQRDYGWSPSLVEEEIGAAEVSLRSDTGHTFALASDGGGWFEKVDLAPSDWQEGTSYDLLEIEGDWPAFTVEDIAANPWALQVYTPNFDGILPSVSMNTSLVWSTASQGDYAVAYLVRYKGDTAVDRVTCTMVDDGSFQVSSEVWTNWSFSYVDYMIMYVGRVEVTETTLPHTHATAQVAGAQWVVGVAWQGI